MSKDADLDKLVAGYLDGNMTPPEFRQLLKLLTTDPEAVANFTRAARIDALLEEVVIANRQDSDAERFWNRMGMDHQNLRKNAGQNVRQQATDVPSKTQAISKQPQPQGGSYLRSFLAMGLAVGILLVVSAGVFLRQSWHISAQSTKQSPIAAATPNVMPFATLRRIKGLSWGEHDPLDVGDRLASGQVIRFKKGMAEIAFDSGTVVVLNAPADAVLQSSRLLQLRQGTITANVAKGDEGFRIDTRRAAVVDLSTAFGVSMLDDQETNVVVFDGNVDVHLDSLPDRSPIDNSPQTPIRTAELRHMTSGDGLQIDSQGKARRLVAINSTAFPTSMSWDVEPGRALPLITAVRDNLHEGDTNKCYRIVPEGLREDAPAYVDRIYEWNGITTEGMPKFLLRADYVMTFNDDKYINQLEVEVTLSAPAVLYVFIDNRVAAPEWLKQEFVDTEFDIGLDEVHYPRREHDKPKVGPGVSINSEFSIWRRELPHAMTVRLGSLGIREIFDATDTAMYSIAAVPLVRGE